jgi:hypothetical protein
MSGFLGRMVIRALTPQRVLRPRARTAFESFAPAPFEETTWAEPSAAKRTLTIERPPIVREHRERIAVASTHAPAEIVRTSERQKRAPSAAPRENREAGAESRTESHSASGPETIIERIPIVESTIVEREVSSAPQMRTIMHTRRGADRIERLRLRSERTTVERERVSDGPIEITIGRIDVRAVVDNPREAPRAARPAAPSMSLRDYLEQRDARRRR